MADLTPPRNISWLVDNFVDRTPGVTEAVVLSSDGLPLACPRPAP